MTTRTPILIARGVALAALAMALLGVPGLARASDAGVVPSGASISPEYYAPRYVRSTTDVAPAHLNDFSPLAINYADCVGQIDIEFSLDLAGDSGDDEIQVWAGSGAADCTQTSARSNVSNASPDTFPGRCWPVAAPGTFSTTSSVATARINVLDLVSHIGDPNPPTTYATTIDAAVCKPHATSSAVPLNIYFFFAPAGSGRGSVPVAPPDGIPGLYQTPAALVGPFAPTGVTAPNTGITATSLTVGWIPQGESIIQGFNIYIEDQGPSGLKGGKPSADSGAALVYGVECHPALACSADAAVPAKDAAKDAVSAKDAGKKTVDGGTRDATLSDAALDADPADADVDGEVDGGADGEADGGFLTEGCDGGRSDAFVAVDAAAFAGESDAQVAAQGCEFTGPINLQNANGSGPVLSCNSALLVDVFTVDGGTGTAVTSTSDASAPALLTTTVSDDAGEGLTDAHVDTGIISLTSATGVSVQETAGISNIPASHLAFYATGAGTNSYTINNLNTGDQYAIAVAAVDSYGNVGPLGSAISPITGDVTGGLVACSTPTPVDDFFMQYSLDGGRAGGGFCTVTDVGAPAPFFASIFGAGFLGAAIGRGRRRRGRHAQRRAP